MPEWQAIRAANADRLAAALGQSDLLRIPQPQQGLTHAWYRFYAYLRPERLAPGWDRDRVLAEVNARGLPVFSGSCSEIYLEQVFAGPGNHPEAPLPIARELGQTSLAFLVDPTWSAAELDAISAGLLEVLADANA